MTESRIDPSSAERWTQEHDLVRGRFDVEWCHQLLMSANSPRLYRLLELTRYGTGDVSVMIVEGDERGPRSLEFEVTDGRPRITEASG